MNINLNAGGIVGGLLSCLAAFVGVFMIADPMDDHGMYRLVIVALIGGAFAGNFLWGLAFKKAE